MDESINPYISLVVLQRGGITHEEQEQLMATLRSIVLNMKEEGKISEERANSFLHTGKSAE